MSIIALGFAGSLAAGMLTFVGALPVLAIREMSPRVQDVMLGFAAGVMLAASFFSLILPGLEAAQTITASEQAAAMTVIAGILLGAFAVWSIHRFAPHEHFIVGREGTDAVRLSRIWLFVIAITLHNFPEGLAVGVGFGGGDVDNGIALAIGIGLQNMPEGLAVAVALLSEGYKQRTALLVALATGLVEPIGGVVGATIVSLSLWLLPWGLAFAAGAMLFVISDEIIPETHRKEFATQATAGLMAGFAVMMYLDVVLG
ncbi:MAG: ZIP family metal transporter [Rhodospirillaceae bacterium]|nr:ZIP family metal transporter [Rhodospirillaceae bacterium]